jgi:hypothetical protein
MTTLIIVMPDMEKPISIYCDVSGGVSEFLFRSVQILRTRFILRGYVYNALIFTKN